jgi:hypothetical protein
MTPFIGKDLGFLRSFFWTLKEERGLKQYQVLYLVGPTVAQEVILSAKNNVQIAFWRAKSSFDTLDSD